MSDTPAPLPRRIHPLSAMSVYTAIRAQAEAAKKNNGARGYWDEPLAPFTQFRIVTDVVSATVEHFTFEFIP